MEAVWSAVKLMFFVYGLAAVLSLIVAWILKLLFAAVQAQKARATTGDGGDAGAGGDETRASEGSA